MTYEVEFPVPPASVNHSYNPAMKFRKGGKQGLSFRLTPEVREYKNVIRQKTATLAIRPIRGDVHLSIKWFRAREKGDVPERWKALLDALQSKDNYGFGLYVNDAQIAKFTVERDDSQKDRPRVVVWVKPAE